MAAQPEPSAPPWNREPHRLLFPLGAALAVVAVLPFAFFGAGGGALALFHSVAQIEGFLTCFLVGFLYTFVPRRTRTLGPDSLQMTAALALPSAAVALAWAGDTAMAHGLWLLLVGVVLDFTLSRLRGARVPAVAVWIPLALVAGAAGAVLIMAEPLAGRAAWAIGRGLLVQGLFAGLVLGVSGFLVPQLTRGEPGPDRPDAPRARGSLALHGLLAAAFFGSFPLEVLWNARLGLALRALVATGVLLAVARIHRPPSIPGLHRRLVWLAAWLVAAGFWILTLSPRLRGAGLHVLFVGGFAQLTLAVAAHAAFEDARPERLSASPRSARAMAGLLAVAFGGRVLAAIDLRRVAPWLAVASVAFCGAVAAWALLVGPQLRGREPGR